MKIPAILAVAATAALTLSACGGTAQPPRRAAAPAGSSSSRGAAGLHVATTSLGKVLVDSSGTHRVHADRRRRDHSTCSSACLHVLAAGRARRPGADGHRQGRLDAPRPRAGRRSPPPAGEPVYTFIQDQKPGDVNGERACSEFGGIWYAVSPLGSAAVKRVGLRRRPELVVGSPGPRLLRFVAARPSMGDWAGHDRVPEAAAAGDVRAARPRASRRATSPTSRWRSARRSPSSRGCPGSAPSSSRPTTSTGSSTTRPT